MGERVLIGNHTPFLKRTFCPGRAVPYVRNTLDPLRTIPVINGTIHPVRAVPVANRVAVDIGKSNYVAVCAAVSTRSPSCYNVNLKLPCICSAMKFNLRSLIYNQRLSTVLSNIIKRIQKSIFVICPVNDLKLGKIISICTLYLPCANKLVPDHFFLFF